ncbi:DUF547 domain-containing protein [Solirubrum puertoriconensis]|uniref:DUF547 domain-containing protein n=1 Tax=Solirubrum puertoriconensis TaxID=1751427 RepID=A0A9X0HPB1_SOLP1|nr:DUF547 domain-containing protein [Solirubrum puertoriconensis]KUG09659.1 hypothetical protein ASU33_18390 [Solirubrum puertoriconensis]
MQHNYFFRQLLLWLVLLTSTVARANQPAPQAAQNSYEELLKRHVLPDGRVDYEGLAEEEEQLLAYLKTLSSHPPLPSWSRYDQAAFWLNAYNAYTLYLAVQYYPVERLSDIKIKSVGGYRSVWDAPEVTVGGKQYTLKQIEREILPELLPNEPRRHFALHCAATSSPTLLPEPYEGGRLDTQLTQQTARFINDSARNVLAAGSVQISSLFDWFAVDFGDKAQLIEFINRYAKTQIEPTATVAYVPYDWTLNDSHGPGVVAQRKR